MVRRKGVRLTETWRRVLYLLLIAVVAGVLLWIYGPVLWELARDEAALEQLIASLGWWGPLALVAINAAQIVVAPIPGYVVQAVAGYLYGPLWGSVWGTVGLLVGALLAMALSRQFGRPLVQRLVGRERLDGWEEVTLSTNTMVWFLILLAPSGDLPYFMAGLARVSFVKILLLTLMIRGPTTVVVAAAGAGAWSLPAWQLVLILAALGVLSLLFFRYQDQLAALIDRRVIRQFTGGKSS